MLPSANVSLLIFLYFIQGLPYGFQTRFLPIYLHAKGVSLTNVGLLRLVQLPWLLKALWAPFIDCYSTKRRWLLLSIAGLLLTCVVASLLSIEPMQLVMLLFVLNLFSVTHDIIVDSIAIGILQNEKDLGLGNTAQVVGYKIGSVFGGGLLMVLVDYFGWSGMCIGVAMIYGEAFFFVYLSPILRTHEHVQKVNCLNASFSITLHQFDDAVMDNDTKHDVNGHICSPMYCDGTVDSYSCHVLHDEHHHHCCCQKELQNKDESQATPFLESPLTRFTRYCRQLFQVSGTSWMIVFLMIYKLGEQGALNLLPLYLVERGMPSADMIFWTSVIGQSISILGSMIGGALMARLRLPMHMLLQQLCLLRLMPAGGMLLLLVVWEMQPFSEQAMRACMLLLMGLLLLLSGAITSTTFTVMMRCSRLASPWLQGTHYAVLSTVETLGKVIFVSFVGIIVDHLGYQATFLGLLLLSFASVQVLRRLPQILAEELSPTSDDATADEGDDAGANGDDCSTQNYITSGSETSDDDYSEHKGEDSRFEDADESESADSKKRQ